MNLLLSSKPSKRDTDTILFFTSKSLQEHVRNPEKPWENDVTVCHSASCLGTCSCNCPASRVWWHEQPQCCPAATLLDPVTRAPLHDSESRTRSWRNHTWQDVKWIINLALSQILLGSEYANSRFALGNSYTGNL